MFLAASPSFRREILTWTPDVPCSQAEITSLTECLSSPFLPEDPATLSAQLQDWMRTDRSHYKEPLPNPAAPTSASSPSSSPTPTPAQGAPPPVVEDEESTSHNWTEGARIGEANNPGPSTTAQRPTYLQALTRPPPAAPTATLQKQLLNTLQLLLATLQQVAPHTPTPPSPLEEPQRRRRRKRSTPGSVSSPCHPVRPTRLNINKLKHKKQQVGRAPTALPPGTQTHTHSPLPGSPLFPGMIAVQAGRIERTRAPTHLSITQPRTLR